jgi:DNA integrity scanning protein DisA with diadenylate cyclase activity
MLELLHQIRWQDALDIGIITFLVYRALQIVRGSRAMQMIIGLAVILVAYVSSRTLGCLPSMDSSTTLSSIILVIIVIFQSDIRRALTQVGTAPLFSTLERSEQRREDVIEEVAQAAMSLASKRVGALVVIQREVGLSEFMEIGTRLDAWVSRELLESVFLPHSPIHTASSDSKGRVTAVAACCRSVPIRTAQDLGHAPSRRPRVTGGSDAAVVVSEQEGTVALVVAGNVTENIDGARLRSALRDLIKS